MGRTSPPSCGLHPVEGFPDSSVGKESACNAGDPSSIPGIGRSTGKGIGYPLQYSWASLVAQTVKNLPAMQETWVRSLGQEDLLEKEMATHSSILTWRIPWTVAHQAPLTLGILQPRILEWVAISSSKGSSQPRD